MESRLSTSARSVAEMHAERRHWNARAISLAFGILGLLTLASLAAARAPDLTDVVAFWMALPGLLSFVAYLIVRSGRVLHGILMLMAMSLTQHVAIASTGAPGLITPYFASVFVLVAATCLRPKDSLIAFPLGAVALAAEWYVTSRAEVDSTALFTAHISAGVLYCVVCTVAWLSAAGAERAFDLAVQHETARRALTRELEKSARMEALGRLAGGVAHDFNNLLVVIQGSADLAALDLPTDHPAVAELEHIQNAAGRAADLTAQLLAFSKRQMVPPARIVPADIVRGLEPILRRLVGTQHELTLDVEPIEDSLFASRSQLEQVVMNLAANARDAMQSGGHLAIRLGKRHLDGSARAKLPPGNYLELSVKDDGAGIPPDVMAHLFEPFFTTKEPGRGTGLGLATCFGIVSQMGGAIRVESAVGKGSTFVVLLPLEQHTGELDGGTSPRGAGRPRRALVVDDDENVRTLVARILANAGLSVVEAHDGKTSLETSAANPELDVIITDVVLGAEDGMSILERLRQSHPTATLVVMSSFSPNRQHLAHLTRHGARFLAKPFTAADLLEVVGSPDAPAPSSARDQAAKSD